MTELPICDVRFHGEYWGQSGPAADVTQSTQMTPSGHCPADALLAQLPTTWLYGEGRGKLSQTYPGVQHWPRIA